MRKYDRWKLGMQAVTPLQQLRAKRLALWGQVFGLVFAMVIVAVKGLYYWLPFLGFTLILLAVELLSINQQVWRLEAITKGGLYGS